MRQQRIHNRGFHTAKARRCAGKRDDIRIPNGVPIHASKRICDIRHSGNVPLGK